MPSKHLLLYLFSAVSFLSSAQHIKRASNNPAIIKYNGGFIIADFDKESKQRTFKLVQYDKNLNPLDSLIQPVKDDGYYTIKKFSYGYEFTIAYNVYSSEGAFLRIDSSLKKISFEEFDSTTPYYQEAIGAHNYSPDSSNFFYNNYYNFYVDETQKFFQLEDYLIRFNKGEQLISVYKRKQPEIFQAYNKLWQLKMPEQDYSYRFKIFPAANGMACLYLGGKKDYLYYLDYTTGEVLFKLKLELPQANQIPVLSNVLIDRKNKSILISGGYYDAVQKKKDPTLNGYFVMLIDEKGNLIKERNIPLETPDIRLAKKKLFEQKALTVQKMTINSKGNYQMLAENMLIDWNSAGTAGNTITVNTFKTYGFTFLEFDQNLNVVDSTFQPVGWISKNGALGTTPSVWELHDLALQGSDYEHKLRYCVSNASQTNMVYAVPVTDYQSIKRMNKEFVTATCPGLQTNPVRAYATSEHPVFFEADENSYYVFIPFKNKFIFEKRKY